MNIRILFASAIVSLALVVVYLVTRSGTPVPVAGVVKADGTFRPAQSTDAGDIQLLTQTVNSLASVLDEEIAERRRLVS